MSGGSAAALFLALTRSHYARDDAAFAGVAQQLARQTKDPEFKRKVLGIIHNGFTRDPSPAPRGAYSPPPSAAPHQAPTSKILERLKPISFPDLMLEPDVQQMLDEIIVELEYREQLAKRKLRARNRLLFWGPPGNGKTAASTALAGALGVPAYAVSLPALCSRWVSATGENLGELFASIHDDMVVVFDEIDAIGATRGDAEQSAGKERNSIVNTLLTLLDRNERGVMVATTNRPDIIDKALLRRFDETIYFPPPNPTQMRGLSGKLSKHYGVPVVDVSGCENFDGVTKTVQREARRHVMREILAEKEEEETDGEEETDEETE
jgi:SpoVK/Ycf46/Vps4 family AAA+-type ATPase